MALLTGLKKTPSANENGEYRRLGQVLCYCSENWPRVIFIRLEHRNSDTGEKYVTISASEKNTCSDLFYMQQLKTHKGNIENGKMVSQH